MMKQGDKIVEEDEKRSPLEYMIPQISTETMRPMFVSFCEKLGRVNLAERESRMEIADMFLEMIVSLAKSILNSLANVELERRETQLSLLISKDAVTRAVNRGLCENFNAALSSSHQSTEKVVDLMTTEVTGHINSVLSCSQVQGMRLKLAEDSNYRPPKENMKKLIFNAKTLLHSIKEKITQCVSCEACTTVTSPQDEDENQPHSPKLQAPMEREQVITGDIHPETSTQSSTEPSEVMSGQDRVINISTEQNKHLIEETVQSETVEKSRHSTKLHSLGSPPPPLSFNTVSLGSTESISSAMSLKIREVTKMLKDMLMNEAENLSGEDQTSLSRHSLETANSIVSDIIEEIDLGETKARNGCFQYTSSFMKRMADKVRSFFMLCFAKGSLRHLLSQLCRGACTSPDDSVESVIEQASPLLQKLVQEDGDVSETLPKSVELSDHLELSELASLISTSLFPLKDQQHLRTDVQSEVNTFVNNMSQCVSSQTELPFLTNPVGKVLADIQQVASLMSEPNQNSQSFTPLSTNMGRQNVLTETQSPCVSTGSYHSSIILDSQQRPMHIPAPQTSPAVYTALEQTTLDHHAPVSSSTPNIRKVQPSQWSREDCNILLCKTVSRIFRTKWRPDIPKMVSLSRELQMLLEERVSEWDILVKPCQSSYQYIADAVYRDLSRGFKKRHVLGFALTTSTYSDTIVNCIQWHLEEPEKKQTVGSRLRSAWDAFCLFF